MAVWQCNQVEKQLPQLQQQCGEGPVQHSTAEHREEWREVGFRTHLRTASRKNDTHVVTTLCKNYRMQNSLLLCVRTCTGISQNQVATVQATSATAAATCGAICYRPLLPNNVRMLQQTAHSPAQHSTAQPTTPTCANDLHPGTLHVGQGTCNCRMLCTKCHLQGRLLLLGQAADVLLHRCQSRAVELVKRCAL